VWTLREKGEVSTGGGGAGDALIEITVRPHRFFKRDGDDIRLDLPTTLTEAVLGGRLAVPTPDGRVTVTIPKVQSRENSAAEGRGGRAEAISVATNT
jgi:DnaJ-class molecular chaperone